MNPPTPYVVLLRLHRLSPSAWQRVLFLEGAITLGSVLALFDVATAWTPLILPLAVAAVVKTVDGILGFLPPDPAAAGSADVPAEEASQPPPRRLAA